MERKLLVVGIDPGITTGYALLDINGKLLKLGSTKQLNLGSLIFWITKHGKVVVVGSDVKPVSKFVESFSKRVGAKLIYPKESLKIVEKKRLINNYNVEDSHQRDALSAALFAYKKIRSLLNKVDIHLSRKEKEAFSDDVKRLLLTKKGGSIIKILKILEKEKN